MIATRDLSMELWGTSFFVVLATYFLGIDASNLVDFDFAETAFYSFLATKTLAFWLLAWTLVILFRFGPRYFSSQAKSLMKAFVSHSYRFLAWVNFRKAFLTSVSVFLSLYLAFKSLGAFELQRSHFEAKSLWVSYYMLTDPLASFIFYYVLVDWLRIEFLSYSQRMHPLLGFISVVFLESLVWVDFFNLNFKSLETLILVSWVIFFSLLSIRSISLQKRTQFWQRFAIALVSFFMLCILTNILTTTWSFSWSFFTYSSSNTLELQLLVLILAFVFNAAALQKFSAPLTRSE